MCVCESVCVCVLLDGMLTTMTMTMVIFMHTWAGDIQGCTTIFGLLFWPLFILTHSLLPFLNGAQRTEKTKTYENRCSSGQVIRPPFPPFIKVSCYLYATRQQSFPSIQTKSTCIDSRDSTGGGGGWQELRGEETGLDTPWP
jgi:hypothetical protein